MKKNVSLVYILFVSVLVLGQPLVETVFDFNNVDYVNDIIELEEGGFLILGATTIDGVGKNVFIRINDNGDTLWTKIKPYYGYSIVQYDSLYYYISGSYISGVTGFSDGVLNKLDNNFNRLWIKTFSSNTAWMKLSNIKKSRNNELLLNWYRIFDDWQTPPLECLNAYDTSGNALWGAGCSMAMKDFEQLPNKNLIKLGKDGYGYNDYVRVYDSAGNYVYNIDLVGHGYTILNEIILSGDTAFIIGREDGIIRVHKIETDTGVVVWEKQYFDGNVVSACNGMENQMLITGTSTIDNNISAYVFRINSEGDSLSTSVIDKFYNLQPRKIISNNENFYLIGTIEYEDESKDIYFLKAPLDTVLVGGREIISGKLQDLFNVYPNPAKTKITVSLQFAGQQAISLRTYNLNGQEIYNKTISSNSTKHEIDISNWQPGIYVLGLYEKGDLLQTRELVVTN